MKGTQLNLSHGLLYLLLFYRWEKRGPARLWNLSKVHWWHLKPSPFRSIKGLQAEVRGGAEAGTVSSCLCEAGWNLHETGHYCCGWDKRQGQESWKVCLRSIWCALHTVVQFAYCSTLEGAIHSIIAAPYFPALYIGSQMRFCLKEIPLLKKKM